MNRSEIKFSCIILAGGEGKRVGGQDKGLITYKDKTLTQHVINTVKSQCDEIIISANRNIKNYQTYGYKVISDSADHYLGPLAGIAAALPHCKNDWVLIVPCDMPFLPSDIIETLSSGMSSDMINDITDHNICIAETNDRLQLVLLINKKLQPSLAQSLQNNQLRLMQWVKSQQPLISNYSESSYFKNFNSTDDF